MELIYNFPNKSLKFDCLSCPDVCCHVANSLLMNENQKNNVLSQNKLLSSFINKKEDVYNLSVGKQCWFLQENGCGLHSEFGSGGKPLTCQVYPFKVWRLTSDIYFVDYIPCPDFKVVNDSTGISYSDLNPTIKEYIQLIKPKINPIVHGVEKQEIENHLEQHHELLHNPISLEDFPFELLEDSEIETFNRLLILYPQFETNPIALTKLKEKKKFKNIYLETLLEVITTSKFKSIQNIYLLSLKQFNQRLLAL